VRLAFLVACTWAFAALLPLVAGLDERLFLAVNSLGAGPDWIHQALDPHTRNYILISVLAVAAAPMMGRRAVIGTAAAVLIAAFFSDVLVQLVYLLYDRARPEEVLGAQALLLEDRTWAHIASFPSGHLVVTTAIAVAGMSAVPALRGPLWLYVGAIALTRVTFGAHFPLDVVVGLVFGYEVGRFSAALAHGIGLLPHAPADPLAIARWRHWPVPGLARATATGESRQP
jgi:undecaprenyl-diphosphatase